MEALVCNGFLIGVYQASALKAYPDFALTSEQRKCWEQVQSFNMRWGWAAGQNSESKIDTRISKRGAMLAFGEGDNRKAAMGSWAAPDYSQLPATNALSLLPGDRIKIISGVVLFV